MHTHTHTHAQTSLSSCMQQEIIQELRTPDRLRETLDVVDIVLGFLSSGGGRANQSLGRYISHTLKMKGRPFSEKVFRNFCCCCCCFDDKMQLSIAHSILTSPHPLNSSRLETVLLVTSCPSGRPSLWNLHDSSHSSNRYSA